MNAKRKTIFCVAIVLFCTFASFYAQDSYVSQSDIDIFVANFDALMNDDVLDDAMSNGLASGMLSIPTAVEFSTALGEYKDVVANVLRDYGMDSEHPVEVFYTILIGIIAVEIDVVIDSMLQVGETEKEKQELMRELQKDEYFLEMLKLKKSIHLDDLSLITENFESLSQWLH